MLFDLASIEEIGKTLAHRLRVLRLQQSLSQAELAARSGVSERALRNVESTGQTTLETFLRITQALGRASDLETILEVKIQSIRAMEDASKARKRAPRRKSGSGGTVVGGNIR